MEYNSINLDTYNTKSTSSLRVERGIKGILLDPLHFFQPIPVSVALPLKPLTGAEVVG